MKREEIIVEHNLDLISSSVLDGYIFHAFCHEGSCSLVFNGTRYVFKAGYRLIDTAQAYMNEEGVGNAIAKSS